MHNSTKYLRLHIPVDSLLLILMTHKILHWSRHETKLLNICVTLTHLFAENIHKNRVLLCEGELSLIGSFVIVKAFHRFMILMQVNTTPDNFFVRSAISNYDVT